jgi:sugar phosphate isomerase/epimerase
MYQPAVQMYTLRDYMETSQDFAESLAKVSEIGYRAVQLSAVGAMAGDTPTVTPGQARRMLDDNGLKCIGTHRSWESLAQDTTREIDFHQVLGCGYAAIGGLPDNYRVQGASGFTAFLRDSAPVVAMLKEAGIRFGYHNHAWEFERAGFQNGLPRT